MTEHNSHHHTEIVDAGHATTTTIPPTLDPMIGSKKAQIEVAFTYHPPKPGQPERYTAIRDKAKELALLIFDNTPVSREQSLALTDLEQCVMWANAAIARHE